MSQPSPKTEASDPPGPDRPAGDRPAAESPAATKSIADLLALMAALRTPGTGCPWDLEQTSLSILPYTLEEAQEVADAILRADDVDLREELGDLLLQVVFHARIAEEAERFDFGDVVEAISAKLIRRHPHVFGDCGALSADAVSGVWNAIKSEEKRARAEARRAAGQVDETASAISGVLRTAPSLSRALKLQQKAGKVGFDWNDARAVLDKIREETCEVEAAFDGGDPVGIEEEIGDLLFAVANLARHANTDPEAVLHRANDKFERRFRAMEALAADQGRSFPSLDLDAMEELWRQVKAREPKPRTT